MASPPRESAVSGLTLLTGPANAGKVALLLERYLARLDEEPVLIVPNGADVVRRQRDLLTRCGALMGGWIGTFDDLFGRVAQGDPDARPVATDAQRALLVRRAIASASLNGLARSARSGGFADTLLATLGELEQGLVEPGSLDGDLAGLYAAYRAELDRTGLWDRDLQRARSAERLASAFDAWNGEPVFAYGFEDLTAAEWRLLEALAGRAEVTISMPYEPGRAAFESLHGTAEDLASLADGRIEELPARSGDYAHPAIAHIERGLFADGSPPAPEIDGAVRFFEGAGTRGALELVAEELLELIRTGTPPERIAVVCPSLERWRAPLETALGTFGVPYALEGRMRLGQTPFGQALGSLLRFAWQEGTRRDLYAFLRSPYSGIERRAVDFTEGRLRGRAIEAGPRAEEETEKLRDGAPLPALRDLRAAEEPLDGVRDLVISMLRNAYGTEEPPATEAARLDLRCFEAATRILGELTGWEGLTREDVVATLDRAPVRLGDAREQGRVAVLDLLRVRTRRYDVVFVLGLEEGVLPRRTQASPFLDETARRTLDARLERPDQVSRDRYLFYTACSRATRRVYLVREAATDDGAPREPSPFWEEVWALFPEEDAVRWRRRRALSELTWRLESAPTERERLRSLAVLAASDRAQADSLALANGWERRLDRALGSFRRETRLRHPLVLEQLQARRTFPVTELERFADCSQAWFVERFLDPKTIDAEVDAKLKGSVAHSALFKFFSGLPKELGIERVEPDRVDDCVRFMRTCLDTALAGVRMEMTEMQRRELDSTLWRDLEKLVHAEAETELQLVPRRFEVSFGNERSPQELQRGLDLGGVTLSGKIDRIDVDPFSARGMVVDYKSGKGAYSAVEIEKELRLQIPLYMLVLRDLVGIEPLGGVYRPLAGDGKARGLLRAEAKEEGLPGFVRNDYLDEEQFWRLVEGARETARGLAERIRAGDVRHDPRGDECPAWCDLWAMCRVRRA
jgi:ATP-dependent helicase/DNAse subunit B